MLLHFFLLDYLFFAFTWHHIFRFDVIDYPVTFWTKLYHTAVTFVIFYFAYPTSRATSFTTAVSCFFHDSYLLFYFVQTLKNNF